MSVHKQVGSQDGPLITVIVPAYNSESSIARCMDSIVGQTIFEQVEVVFVDDGSTDATWQAVAPYGHHDNVRLVRAEHGGVSAARNRGMAEARGSLVTFVDSDDYLAPEYLETLVGFMDDGVSIVASEARDVDEFGSSLGGRTPTCVSDVVWSESYDPRAQYLHDTAWGCLYRRELAVRHPFDARFSIGEDTLFFFSCFRDAGGYRHIPYHGYCHVMREGSLAHGAGSYIENVRMWRCVADTMPKQPGWRVLGCASASISDAIIHRRIRPSERWQTAKDLVGLVPYGLADNIRAGDVKGLIKQLVALSVLPIWGGGALARPLWRLVHQVNRTRVD